MNDPRMDTGWPVCEALEPCHGEGRINVSFSYDDDGEITSTWSLCHRHIGRIEQALVDSVPVPW